MNCLTVSDLSLLENLERRLQDDVSVSLLAELERELLRLRTDLDPAEWEVFCEGFSQRPVCDTLRLGSMAVRRAPDSPPIDSPFIFPPDSLDVVLADSFKARPFAAHSPAYLIGAWEYSLPVSRSVRARKAYFAREITEVLGSAIKPRILILGTGPMHEADDAIHASRLQFAEFVAVEPNAKRRERLRRMYPHNQLRIDDADWVQLPLLAPSLGTFDLIYSSYWLDMNSDSEALGWLETAMELLRPCGRILATNFAPGSRDVGWIEACWNWRPHFRSEEDLATLVMQLKNPEVRAMVRGHAVSRDESGASAYLEIHSI